MTTTTESRQLLTEEFAAKFTELSTDQLLDQLIYQAKMRERMSIRAWYKPEQRQGCDELIRLIRAELAERFAA